MEGQRSLNFRNVERNIMDSVGYGATHHPTKIDRKEDEKGDRKGNGKGTQKGGKFKGGKSGKHGKVNEIKDNVSTKSQNHQKKSGQVDLRNNGQNNLGMPKQTLRIGGTMTGTQQIRILRPHQQQRNFNMCRGIKPCTSYSRTNDYVKLWLRHCVQLYAQQQHA